MNNIYRHVFLVMIMLVSISGCNSTTFPSDPRMLVEPVDLKQGIAQTNVYYIWAPPAATADYLEYVSAFNESAAKYLQSENVQNGYNEAQGFFEQFVQSQGGLFSVSNGRIDQEKLNTAIVNTSRALFAQNPKLQYIAFLIPFTESIKIEDGEAVWQNTRQKRFENNAGSKSYAPAISVKINYINRALAPVSTTVGLDIHPADADDTRRYRHIVEHVFSPMIVKADL